MIQAWNSEVIEVKWILWRMAGPILIYSDDFLMQGRNAFGNPGSKPSKTLFALPAMLSNDYYMPGVWVGGTRHGKCSFWMACWRAPFVSDPQDIKLSSILLDSEENRHLCGCTETGWAYLSLVSRDKRTVITYHWVLLFSISTANEVCSCFDSSAPTQSKK